MPVMVLGAVCCNTKDTRAFSLQLRNLKRRHNLADDFEIKWGKVSPAKITFYTELLDLFFSNEALSFRGLVVPNKAALRHAAFGQTHDRWYYKMYYLLLRPLLKERPSSRVLIDIKDTQGSPKIEELELYLRRHLHADDKQKLVGIQLVASKEVPCAQLADLLAGVLSYHHRKLATNSAKQALIKKVQEHTGLTLQWSTAPGRKKFDMFVWEANAGDV